MPTELSDKMTMEKFEKARCYGLDKMTFAIVATFVFSIVITSMEIYFGLLSMIWMEAQRMAEDYFNVEPDNEIVISCIFLVLMQAISIVKETPVAVYKTFVLEEKHGFNKQTPWFFVKDQIKGNVLSAVIGLPVASAVIFIVNSGGDFFFIWLYLFVSCFTLLFMTIYPSLIAPLFDTYRPLEEGPLRSSIEKLASSLEFPLGQLYVVEGSKRSAHSNAYFYGLMGAKRIVLFDTLIQTKKPQSEESSPEKTDEKAKVQEEEEDENKGCSEKEVLAVLGHELGHWKLGHVTKNMIIIQVHLFLVFFAFAFFFKNELFYQALGFPVGSQPVLIGLLVVFTYVLAPYNTLLSFGMTILTRRFEYQADEFAQQLGYGDDLGNALIKLNLDNLGFPYYDWLYSTWNHSHPTLLQRLQRIRENKKTK